MLPLENIKVLDLTRVLAGPFCTMVLSDLGAEIIKVEIPVKGDDSRHFGPFLNEKSLYFVGINRAKKSISLNLKKEEGKEILKQLVKDVDVIVENYRPGTMEKLGLGYETLKEINPKLIYAASSGFGHTGPSSTKPAYDILAQAGGGMMSITGWPDSPPTRVGMSLGDITASLYTAIGISSALYQRTITGKGQKIDVAMLDCQVSILENALSRFQVEHKSPEPLGNRHPTITPFQAYKAKDKYFVVAVGNDVLFENLCRTLKCTEFLNDDRFTTNEKRTENIDELNKTLEKIFITKTAGEWLKIIEEGKVPCSPINNIEDIMKDEQMIARNMIIDVEDKQAGKIKIAGNPLKMTNIPEVNHRNPAPEIGEHNTDIYGKMLGLSKDEINELKDKEVI
ncbi:MAG: CoA transferase [Bacteroidales bacterium]|nr:CoA transferase [Bacteroidales bacterium]